MLRHAHPEMFSTLFGVLKMYEEDKGGGTGGGGGSGEKKPEDKGGDKGDGKGGDAAEKVTMTKAQLAKANADAATAAVAEAQKKSDEAAATAKAKADKEAAEKRGEFEALYKGEEAKRIAAENNSKIELLKKDVDIELRDYIAEHNPEYTKSATYIRPLIQIAADTKPADITAEIKKHVEKFVADHPQAKGGSPASGANRGQINSKKTKDEAGGDGKPRPMQHTASAF